MNSPQVNLVFFLTILDTILIQKLLRYYLFKKHSTENKMRQFKQTHLELEEKLLTK